jgi:signal transduction histidine kinase
MKSSMSADIAAVQSISAVPTILQVVIATTGLRFACVARVTENSWTTCAVLDKIGFGLKPGDELDVATTLCSEVRDSRAPIVIDKASEDTQYCNHLTPRKYGFESYISLPLYRVDGEYFGTLCALDPLPAKLSDEKTVSTMKLFAELISLQLETQERLDESRVALHGEQQTAAVREQFFAVVSHDLRTPLSSIITGTEVLLRRPIDADTKSIVMRIQRSGLRISSLVDDVLDLARGRMGGGIPLDLHAVDTLEEDLRHVVAELQGGYPDRSIEFDAAIDDTVFCDRRRIAQLLSNVLINALIHGAAEGPVKVTAKTEDDHLLLSVANHGDVISAEAMAHLFEPYWRAATVHPSEGLGLGLYIANEIAISHGGTLQAASVNATTTFAFSMPLRRPETGAG